MSAPQRPLIGITCSTNSVGREAGQPQDRLNRTYSGAVWAAGGVPVILPNLEDGALNEALGHIDGLLLSGGYDVAPSVYGEEPLNGTVSVDSPRDAAELPLIRAAMGRDLAVLAICRGIQVLNVALGGSLIQDIPTQVADARVHSQAEPRDQATHPVDVVPGSRLATVLGVEQVDVNSFHHQAVRTPAPGLAVAARAPDGVIEAVEVPEKGFVLGVQYHPEELTGTYEHARRLFQAFVAACSAPRVTG